MHVVGAELIHANRQTDSRKDADDESNTNFSLVCERGKKDEVFPLRAMKACSGLKIYICSYAVSKSTPAFPTWQNLLSWNGGGRLHQNLLCLATELRIITFEKNVIMILSCFFEPRTAFQRVWGAKGLLDLNGVNYIYICSGWAWRLKYRRANYSNCEICRRPCTNG
jgi:hypothetical protein